MTDDRGWGWLEHLRAGGTTPWSAWHGSAPDAGDRLPSAQHLELLRLVNVAAGGRPASRRMTERVLTAPMTGRGRADLELTGEGTARFGPAPIDPERLAASDVLRVAASALATELVATRVAPWRVEPLRRVRVVRRRRRVERVEVLAGPYDAVLADAWAVASFSGIVPPWERWVRRAARHDLVPPRADLVAVAREWADVVGTDRVVVHTTPGLSALPSRVAGSAAGAALARQVRLALSVAVPPKRRRALLSGPLLSWLGRLPDAGLHDAGLPDAGRPDAAGPAGVPEDAAGWVAAEAARQRAGLRAAGYDFVGDPDLLQPTGACGTMPTAESALHLAVRLLVMRGEGR